MSPRLLFIVAALAVFAVGHGAEQTEAQGGGLKQLNGDYMIYGGELGDTVPPTKKDRKVALTFKGPLAKDLFDQIGPDKKDACGAGPGHRIREKGHLSCIWDRREGHYCYFGLDVVTGKSTYGSTC